MTQKEKEKEIQQGGEVVEKRIKPSVIRRRTAPKPAPAPEKAAPEAKAEETKPAAGAEVQPQPAKAAREPEAAAPAAAEAATAPAAPKAKDEKKDEKKGRPVRGRGKADEKKEAPRKTAARKVKEKSAAEILAELTVEEELEKAALTGAAPEPTETAAPEVQAEAAPAPSEAPSAAQPSVKKEKVFEKEPELKKFFSRRPQKKDRYQRDAKKASSQARPMKKTEITVPKAAKRVIRIVDAISVADLSQKLGVKAGEIIKKLMGLGIMATVNQLIDLDAVTLIAQEYGHEVESTAVLEENLMEAGVEAPEGERITRAPVVTVMGHVDHGKTSLLDAIRKTNVVSGEAGGITQHIGAYHVHLDKGDVTFLDTPGHEAFTAMRARGAKATDLVILVVAADDGVMPQTVEAINHARAAGVPIIVAINKIDLPQADSGKIKQELTGYGLVSEEWGGDTIFVEVSAKKGIKIKELLEMILLQAEVLELKASPDSPARGIVVEAKLDKGRGPVSTVLIQDGSLKVGDAIVTGMHYGRVRAMINDWGKRVESAGPSMPIEILGLSGVPLAGDTFVAVKDEATAKQIAAIRERKSVERERLKTAKVSLTDLYDKINKGEVKELNLIIKADVQGSIEAVKETLGKLSTEAVKIKVIHSAAGGINEGDVMLAAASNAIVIGFNIRPDAKAQALAERENVDLRLYDIIYNLVDEIKAAMEGMLSPVVREEVLGRAAIRDVFRITKVGNVAGCFMTDGKAVRGAKARLVRDNVVIYDGKLSSLKRFKDDVKEVASGFECGMTIEGYNDYKVGDVIELYVLKEEAAKL
ncbi:MAG: translation initiation factor IF-2 [Deltaproteobacteria bacterium]|nr:translation initiation factor IF-2 [Deltaproteobacteria bacterium]MBZ0218821.1 translation initiation factor IF-2 [Deltaproteobacteria bacterium]